MPYVYSLGIATILYAMIIFAYFLAKTHHARKRPNVYYHPYVCRECHYDLIGNIAEGSPKCPECGHINDHFIHQDYNIARALITTGRIASKYEEFHIYQLVQKDTRQAYRFMRTIYADSLSCAQQIGNKLYGNDIRVTISDRSGLVAPVLIETGLPSGISSIDLAGRIHWTCTADMSQGPISNETAIQPRRAQ